VTFDADVVEYVPPSAKHLDIVLHTLDAVSPGTKGTLGPPLLKVAELMTRRGIVVLISDLYEDPESVLRSVAGLRHKGNDVIVFHILDSNEIDFPFTEAAHFEDLETGESIPIVPETLKQDYRDMVSRHLEQLSGRLIENRIDYHRFVTSKPLDFALFEYLSRREHLSRVR
jgi:hypothetical protein